MGGFGVIRRGGDNCDGRKFHFSILSSPEGKGEGKGLSVSEDLYFPTASSFDEEENECKVYGGSCGGWLYFHGPLGEIVICDSINRKSKVLSPPPPPFDPFHMSMFIASGMGYDAKFGDYKVVRYYVQILQTEDEDGLIWCNGCTHHFEVYSFKRPFWRDIRGPDASADFVHSSGVYVNATGRCYWPATYDLGCKEYKLRLQVAKKGTTPYSQFEHVVSFDFATERFHQFHFPATTLGRGATYALVQCHGSLGALVYLRPELQPHDDTSCSSGIPIQLHLWNLKTKSWKLLYKISQHADVARPILGLKDNRLLFLESKPSADGRSQLMVYDLNVNTLEKLDIYDYPGCMYGFSYAESMDPPLPDSRRKRKKTSKKVKKRKPHSPKHR